jgi:hypothetical protein
MTTDIIDSSLHTATIPATYTGPGTVVGNCSSAGGVDSDLSGYFTSDGNATQINLGARPRSIKIVNDTDGITWEWMRGMAATHSIKTTFSGPTIALDTGTAIAVTEAATGSGNWTVTLSATLCATSKLICFWIEC